MQRDVVSEPASRGHTHATGEHYDRGTVHSAHHHGASLRREEKHGSVGVFAHLFNNRVLGRRTVASAPLASQAQQGEPRGWMRNLDAPPLLFHFVLMCLILAR